MHHPIMPLIYLGGQLHICMYLLLDTATLQQDGIHNVIECPCDRESASLSECYLVMCVIMHGCLYQEFPSDVPAHDWWVIF